MEMVLALKYIKFNVFYAKFLRELEINKLPKMRCYFLLNQGAKM